MSRSKFPALVGLLFTLLLSFPALGQPSESCTLRDLRGSYGFTIKGKNLNANVDYIFVGRFEANGSGSFAGQGRQTISGKPSSTQFTGSYQVDSDCTGTATFIYANGILANLYFVIVLDGNELIILESDPGGLESGGAKRISRPRERF